jgi:hypothetical protein
MDAEAAAAAASRSSYSCASAWSAGKASLSDCRKWKGKLRATWKVSSQPTQYKDDVEPRVASRLQVSHTMVAAAEAHTSQRGAADAVADSRNDERREAAVEKEEDEEEEMAASAPPAAATVVRGEVIAAVNSDRTRVNWRTEESLRRALCHSFVALALREWCDDGAAAALASPAVADALVLGLGGVDSTDATGLSLSANGATGAGAVCGDAGTTVAVGSGAGAATECAPSPPFVLPLIGKRV